METVFVAGAKKKEESDKKVTLNFDLSTISQREVTKRAELRIRPLRHSRRAGDVAEFRARVCVFDGDVKVKRLTYHIKAGKVTTDGFAVLDLTPIVKDVVDAGYHKARIEITLKQLSQRARGSRDREGSPRHRRSALHAPDHSSAGTDDAMLVIFTRDKHFFENFRYQATKRHLKHLLETEDASKVSDLADLVAPHEHKSRVRRSKPLSKRHIKNIKDACQKKDLYVDFNQIGWGEWIVYPRRFNAYQCSGKCPLPVSQSYDPTNHAVLQSLVRIRDRGATTRPCCVPSKLRAMSMLYYEHDLIVVRHHEDMIVDKCGCR